MQPYHFFIREKTIDLGKEFKDVDIIPCIGGRQTPEQNRRRKRHTESTPAQKNLNDERSKRYLMWLIKKNFSYGDLHITLSYDDAHIPNSKEAANREVKNFMRRVKYWLKKNGISVKNFKYVIITAVYSADGEPARVHHHILTSKIHDRDAIEDLWHCGAANADRIRNFYNSINKLAGYVAKQTSGDKRWFASKNLSKPKSYNVDGAYKPKEITRILEYHIFDPAFWEKQYKGWEILDRDRDIKVTFDINDRPYIRLQLHKKGATPS
ncbi:MAG: hypothetical protein IJ766_03880 [Clostridia bacterium]|nr:hypothetical protein [Clostridia bacterium]